MPIKLVSPLSFWDTRLPGSTEPAQRRFHCDFDTGSHARQINRTAAGDLDGNGVRPAIAVAVVEQRVQLPPRVQRHSGDGLIERPELLRPVRRNDHAPLDRTMANTT